VQDADAEETQKPHSNCFLTRKTTHAPVMTMPSTTPYHTPLGTAREINNKVHKCERAGRDGTLSYATTASLQCPKGHNPDSPLTKVSCPPSGPLQKLSTHNLHTTRILSVTPYYSYFCCCCGTILVYSK
jgi:hypothetical protein